MKEAAVEAYLRKRVKELGGFHRKVTYQGRNGAPDDWNFFPGGLLLIVECKRPKGGKKDALQEQELKDLRAMGFVAVRINTIEMIDWTLEQFL